MRYFGCRQLGAGLPINAGKLDKKAAGANQAAPTADFEFKAQA